MSENSIREELSETLFRFYDHGTQPNALVEADALLASPVIRRIQAEARASAFRDFADELDRYIGTSLNAGGAGDIARAHANAIDPPTVINNAATHV